MPTFMPQASREEMEASREQMLSMASGLDDVLNGERKARNLPRDVGFVLLVFPYGEHDGGQVNYVSNGADRTEIAILFKEIMARWAGQADVSGSA